MANLSPSQMESLRRICAAVIDSVKAAGEFGAPSGIVYAALMSQGCSFSQYNSLINGLVNAKKLRQEGDLLFAI